MNDELKEQLSKEYLNISGTPKTDTLVSRKRTRNSPELDTYLKKHCSEMDEKLLNEFTKILDAKFAVVTDIKSDTKSIMDKLESIVTDNEALKAEIVILKEDNRKIKKNLEFLQRKAKMKNLIISGLQELKEDDDLERVVKELCEKSLSVHEPILDRVYPVGAGKSILVEFVKQSDVQKVLRNARKLKGTGIWINRDLTYQDRQNRKMLFEVKRKIMEVDKSERAIIRDGYMLFKNKKFVWDEEKGICSAKEEDVQLITDLLKKYEAAQASTASKN